MSIFTKAAKMKWLMILSALSLCSILTANEKPDNKESKKKMKDHPRLLVNKEQFLQLPEISAKNQQVKKIVDDIIRQAEQVITEEPVTYDKKGRRILHVSRKVIHRVLTCATSYHYTKDKKFSDRCIKEMLTAANFKDWNPSHFLDVAEMTFALAIGYDWLYDILSPEDKKIIEEAILEKGLKTSLKVSGWVNMQNNWGQVCHGGMAIGALAIYDIAPKEAEEVIKRSRDKIKISMGEYSENGAYPEGPGYWVYGTTYNVLYFCALETALGNTFDPKKYETFVKSANFVKHTTGPTLTYFNYSDGGSKRSPNWINYWFAKQLNDNDLLIAEKKVLDSYLEMDRSKENRFFALTPFYYVEKIESEKKSEKEFSYLDNDHNPIACHRNSWDDEQTAYVAIKGGSPGANHGHMDSGSFIFELDGVRWAEDLGAEKYHVLESKGLNIWARSQNSDRWKVFRYHNKSHNTLMINNQGQIVNNKSKFTTHVSTEEKKFSILDIKPNYQGQLEKALRGFQLIADDTLIIQDEMKAINKETEIRWAMLTRAEVSLDGNTAQLKMDDKTISFQVLEPTSIKLECYEAEKPVNHWDQENKNAKLLGFKVKLDANEEKQLVIQISRSSNKTPKPITPLANWQEKKTK